MKFAWVIGGVIKDVCPGNPASSYTADIAANYSTVVPDLAKPGDAWDGTTLTPAAPPSPPTPPADEKPRSRVEFMLLFTPAERVAIRAKVADTGTPDAALNDWWAILHDPQLEKVYLGRQSTKDALAYLVSTSLLTAERRTAILAS